MWLRHAIHAIVIGSVHHASSIGSNLFGSGCDASGGKPSRAASASASSGLIRPYFYFVDKLIAISRIQSIISASIDEAKLTRCACFPGAALCIAFVKSAKIAQKF